MSDSKALTGEGLSSEKYNLLAEPALDESDLAPLVSDILDAEAIDNELASVIFHRPLPAVRPTILRMQAEAEGAGDYSWQIINLALLQKMGDPSALPKLRGLSRRKALSPVERRCVAGLVSKAERGEDILFSDIENLQYEDTAEDGPNPL